MNKYLQYFIFSFIVLINTICGITNPTIATEQLSSNSKTKLALKAVGIVGSYFTTYKMIKYIENNQDIVRPSPRGGIEIDLSNIPAGFLGIASFALGTKLLFSAIEQILKERTLKSFKKTSKNENAAQTWKQLFNQIETEDSSENYQTKKEKLRQKCLQIINN